MDKGVVVVYIVKPTILLMCLTSKQQQPVYSIFSNN